MLPNISILFGVKPISTIPKTFIGQYFFYNCWKTVILPFLCTNINRFVKNGVLGQTDLFNFKVGGGGDEKPVV